jgi:hypothetical protein
MLKSISLTAALFLISCHNARNDGTPTNTANNAAGTADTTTPGIDVVDASLLECSAGGKVYIVFMDKNGNGLLDSNEPTVSSQIVCNGITGANGADGVDGTNGHAGISMVFQTVVATANQCTAGGVTLLMALDTDQSLSLTLADENLQSVTLCNGTNGVDGQNGSPAPITDFTPVDYIAACGNTVPYKEILLRLQNGQVLSSFSSSTNGDMTRLAFLPDGVFMNTDTSGCVFTLSTSIDGTTRSVSWNNQVQMSWPLLPL